MQFLRKFIVLVASISLIFCLFMTGVTWTARYTIMDRTQVESWLTNSSVYDNFISEIGKKLEKDQAEQESEPSSSDEEKFDAVVIVRAAKVALPPETLKTNIEAVLNGTYDWLEGKTATIVFNLDLAAAKQKFAEAIGNEALTKASSLPPCAAGELPADFDPFDATCIPSGANLNAEVARIKSEIAASQDILPDTQVTGDDVKVGEEGNQQTVSEAFKNVPKVYQYSKYSALLFAGLALLDVLIIALLTRPHHKASKILAWLFGAPGVIFLLIGGSQVLFNQNFNEAVTANIDDKGVAETIVVPLLKQINSSYAKWNLIFGTAYMIISIICIVLALTVKPKKVTASGNEPTDPTPPIDDSPKQETKPKNTDSAKGPNAKKSSNKKVQG